MKETPFLFKLVITILVKDFLNYISIQHSKFSTMAVIKAFKGIRPATQDKAKLIAARPYDVLNKIEARAEAEGNPLSYYRVTKPELELSDSIDQYAPEVYLKGKENFEKLVADGHLTQDEEPHLYVYGQTMGNRTQYGLVACASVDDYINNIIKKHEKTLPAKEDERTEHIRVSGVQYEPVFFAYRDVDEINAIVDAVIAQPADYNFNAIDGFGHHFWVIRDKAINDRLVELFATKVPYTYIADGHHRTAAAFRAGLEKRQQNPAFTGKEEFNYFLAVHFPASHLKILDYNRVIKDLNGLSKEAFLAKVAESFTVVDKGASEFRPETLHTFSMYLDGHWYELIAKPELCNDKDPIGSLDVTVLSELIFDPILNIGDLRKSKRIDFVGGIRGLGELKKRVDSGEMAVAFAMYPVSMEQLFDIADTDNIMPPKVTWFEPKLRSGLIIHSLK